MDQKTKEFVEACEQRCAKATIGPWDIERDHTLEEDGDDVIGYPETIGPMRHIEFKSALEGDCDQTENDAEFVSNARTDLPETLRIIRERAAEIERLRPDAEAWRKGVAILEELRARVIPCGHTIGDLIGGEGSVTKCGACLASTREHRASLATRIKAAIRRFTVDIDQGNKPNGIVEQAIEDIAHAMEQKRFYSSPSAARTKVCAAMAKVCTALSADTKELRESADAYFGEDFTKRP
jgi:hypothetical protein